MLKWAKIPEELQNEINHITDFTRQTNREASLTFCQKKGRDRLFVANDDKGDGSTVEALDCSSVYGDSERIGDVHTHPVNSETIGILPSQPDLYGTLVDTYNTKRPQISCITNHITDMTECYTPKEVPSSEKLERYEQELDLREAGEGGFYLDNAPLDFDFGFFSTGSGQRIRKPTPKAVVKAIFGASTENLKKNVPPLQRGGFCEYVNNFSVPKDDNVGKECYAVLNDGQLT